MISRAEKEKLANSSPRWMYEFDLGDGIKTPLLTEELRSIHQTREQLIFEEIDCQYPQGLKDLKCLDVACNEGFFSQLLYQRGASVRGIDIRPSNIERARFIQQLYEYSPSRLEFQVEDFFDFPEPANPYEIVFFLGLLYHIENPMLALRKLHRLTRHLLVLETQLTQQKTPVRSGWGQTGVFLELPASLAILEETDPETNYLASFHTLSFIPNAAAVHLMLTAAGFKEVVQAIPQQGMNAQYFENDRAVFFAWK